MPWPPQRILCLTEESVDILHLLGQEGRIVAATPYAARAAALPADLPAIAGFGEADLRAALALRPDLALAAADLQAEFGAALAREGVSVHIFSPHDLSGVMDMTRAVGALVGAPDRAAALVDQQQERIAAMRAAPPPRRPRVWAEQWDAPLMAAPAWASELVEIAGGEDVAAHLRHARGADELIVDPGEIAAMRPELILASWRGKRMRARRVADRPGWALTPAVRNDLVREIPASRFLTPGPALLAEGLDAIRAAVLAAAERDHAPPPEQARPAPPPLSRPTARDG